jgi:hypothetical protein
MAGLAVTAVDEHPAVMSHAFVVMERVFLRDSMTYGAHQ